MVLLFIQKNIYASNLLNIYLKKNEFCHLYCLCTTASDHLQIKWSSTGQLIHACCELKSHLAVSSLIDNGTTVIRENI